MKRAVQGLVLLAALTLAAGLALADGATRITWYGQSAFKVQTPSGGVLLIDPWINNPANPNAAKDMAALDKVGYILVTHGHRDHIGDSVAIAQKTGARLVASMDLSRAMVQYSGFPEKQAERPLAGFPGGQVSLFDGEVTVRFAPAVHSSTLEAVDGPLAGKSVYAGTAGGFVITVKNGPTIYHTGDTDVFSDMSLIGARSKVDIMMACIGGHFTMDPAGAAQAVMLVRPDVVVPMHFGTYPLLAGTPDQLKAALDALPGQGPRAKIKVFSVGESVDWPVK